MENENDKLIADIIDRQNDALDLLRKIRPDDSTEDALDTIIAKQYEIDCLIDQIIDNDEQM